MSRARRASPLPAALRSAAMMSHTHTHPRASGATNCVLFLAFGATPIDPQKKLLSKPTLSRLSSTMILQKYLLAIAHIATDAIVS